MANGISTGRGTEAISKRTANGCGMCSNGDRTRNQRHVLLPAPSLFGAALFQRSLYTPFVQCLAPDRNAVLELPRAGAEPRRRRSRIALLPLRAWEAGTHHVPRCALDEADRFLTFTQALPIHCLRVARGIGRLGSTGPTRGQVCKSFEPGGPQAWRRQTGQLSARPCQRFP